MAKHQWAQTEWGSVDIFDYDQGYHNGPRCALCGRSGCHHCEPSMYEEECPEVAKKETSA
jgi:hypothetical protein